MADEIESDRNLSIRCPACRQRFNVDRELMDRMVECGGCDARFRINDEVIIRSKKFYPGERTDTALNRFQRVPLSAAAPEGLQTMRYADFNNPEQLGPTSPQRVIAGVFGVALMAVTALVFIFSGDAGGSFSGMPLASKLIVSGFVSVLGVVLLLYANPRARFKAGLVGLLFAAGLCSVPFISKGTPTVANRGADPMESGTEPLFPEEPNDPQEELRVRFGTKPLEAEQTAIETSGSGKRAYGVFLTQLAQRNMYTVRDYLIRETEASPSSHPYPRDNGNYLMVLSDVAGNLENVSEIASKLGKVDEVHPDIGLVVVRVDNDQFLAGSAEKLNNGKDPAFYELNKRELQSIDLERVKKAVARLAASEPTIYRTDISRMLVELMGKPGVRFHEDIARALMLWAEEPGPAGMAALDVINRYEVEGLPVPEVLVALVVKEGITDAISAINALWIKNPGLWASHYSKFGETIEPDVLEQVRAESAPLRRSALTILAKVGTEKSLPDLRSLSGDEDPDVRLLAERAIVEITKR